MEQNKRITIAEAVNTARVVGQGEPLRLADLIGDLPPNHPSSYWLETRRHQWAINQYLLKGGLLR